jgi:hypothetical protein
MEEAYDTLQEKIATETKKRDALVTEHNEQLKQLDERVEQLNEEREQITMQINQLKEKRKQTTMQINQVKKEFSDEIGLKDTEEGIKDSEKVIKDGKNRSRCVKWFYRHATNPKINISEFSKLVGEGFSHPIILEIVIPLIEKDKRVRNLIEKYLQYKKSFYIKMVVGFTALGFFALSFLGSSTCFRYIRESLQELIVINSTVGGMMILGVIVALLASIAMNPVTEDESLKALNDAVTRAKENEQQLDQETDSPIAIGDKQDYSSSPNEPHSDSPTNEPSNDSSSVDLSLQSIGK